MLSGVKQSTLALLYPPHCLACNARVDGVGALCAACWRETPFIRGLVCDLCGTPLPGEDTATTSCIHDSCIHDRGANGTGPAAQSAACAAPAAASGGKGRGRAARILCDECMNIARPWSRGRAALLYEGTARRLVLALKHGDRTDLARPAARWMAEAAAPLVSPETVVVPVPLHWSRLIHRRYSQSALLAHELARILGLRWLPDALTRPRRTPMLDGHGAAARFAVLDGAIVPHRRRGAALAGARVLIVDDVMTAGATFAACTGAARQAGAHDVSVLALARVARGTSGAPQSNNSI